jgi:hypothetical protein
VAFRAALIRALPLLLLLALTLPDARMSKVRQRTYALARLCLLVEQRVGESKYTNA